MKKSFSIDSSMQVLSNHAKPQGLQTIHSLREERREAEEAALYRASLKGTPRKGRLAWGASFRPALAALVVGLVLYRLTAAVLLSQLTGSSNSGGSASNQTSVEGCAGVPIMQGFALDRFAGEWHHVAWLHSSVLPGAEPFEQRVTSACTTAGFGVPQGAAAAAGSFDVTFTSRTVGTGRGPSAAAQQAQADSSPTRTLGRGSTPDPAAPAKLQLQLHSGPALPYWVIDTDYAKWALMCSTSVTLGGGKPAQVLTLMSRTWALDRLDMGDRLNDLAALQLPWKDVAFAPVRECMDRMQ